MVAPCNPTSTSLCRARANRKIGKGRRSPIGPILFGCHLLRAAFRKTSIPRARSLGSHSCAHRARSGASDVGATGHRRKSFRHRHEASGEGPGAKVPKRRRTDSGSRAVSRRTGVAWSGQHIPTRPKRPGRDTTGQRPALWSRVRQGDSRGSPRTSLLGPTESPFAIRASRNRQVCAGRLGREIGSLTQLPLSHRQVSTIPPRSALPAFQPGFFRLD